MSQQESDHITFHEIAIDMVRHANDLIKCLQHNIVSGGMGDIATKKPSNENIVSIIREKITPAA